MGTCHTALEETHSNCIKLTSSMYQTFCSYSTKLYNFNTRQCNSVLKSTKLGRFKSLYKGVYLVDVFWRFRFHDLNVTSKGKVSFTQLNVVDYILKCLTIIIICSHLVIKLQYQTLEWQDIVDEQANRIIYLMRSKYIRTKMQQIFIFYKDKANNLLVLNEDIIVI